MERFGGRSLPQVELQGRFTCPLAALRARTVAAIKTTVTSTVADGIACSASLHRKNAPTHVERIRGEQQLVPH
jgi:hypothetical protein